MKRKALRAAFPHTLPICAGFLVLGMSYGFLMKSKGFSFLYPLLCRLHGVCYGESSAVCVSPTVCFFPYTYGKCKTSFLWHFYVGKIQELRMEKILSHIWYV